MEQNKEARKISKIAELKDEYERKLKIEQDKIESHLLKDCHSYENLNKINKNKEIQKLKETEVKTQREMKEITLDGQIVLFQDSLQRRKDYHLQLLKEKIQAEKEVSQLKNIFKRKENKKRI